MGKTIRLFSIPSNTALGGKSVEAAWQKVLILQVKAVVSFKKTMNP
jgi:hypothetical protein